LKKGLSTPLLIRRISSEYAASGKSFWRFELKSGIFWWDGNPVSEQDIIKAIETMIPLAVKNVGAGLWSIPDFSVIKEKKGTVLVSWKSKPSFGPYVLNGIPLTRFHNDKLECAGLYSFNKKESFFELSATPGYASRVSSIELHPSIENTKIPLASQQIRFLFAKDFSGLPSERPSDTPASCTKVLSLPLLSVVNWNKRSGYAARPELRRIFTNLVPRGELLRAGAAYMGVLLSGPIPREHPGYNKEVLIRPFQIEQAASNLEQLGYKRKEPDKPRLDLDGKPMKLTLVVDSNINTKAIGLIEKVLTDSFAVIGIGVSFEHTVDGKVNSENHIDGKLSGLKLPWPSLNLLGDFHSHAAIKKEPFWGGIYGSKDKDQKLDSLLESYALSLTQEKPDFQILRNIHKVLSEGEVFTILLQHQVCLEVDSSLRTKTKNLTIVDPDWFKTLLLN